MLVAISTAKANGTVSDSELSVLVFENTPGIYAATFVYAITMTIMVYDIFLTLDDEKVYVWSSKWSPIKILFLIIRYFPPTIFLFGVITSTCLSNLSCRTFSWCASVGYMFVLAAADMFLTYRVYAFCGKNKFLLSFLVLTFLGWETAFVALTIAKVLSQDVIALHPLPPLNSFSFPLCATEEYPSELTTIWIGTLCYQSVLFLCFVLSAIYKHGIFDLELFLGLKHAPLYRVFMRDGLWVYFVIVVSLALNVIASLEWKALSGPFVIFLTVITSIGSCRFIINIRSAAYNPMSDISI